MEITPTAGRMGRVTPRTENAVKERIASVTIGRTNLGCPACAMLFWSAEVPKDRIAVYLDSQTARALADGLLQYAETSEARAAGHRRCAQPRFEQYEGLVFFAEISKTQ